MKNKEIEIIVDLKIGKASSFVLTNDLGHEYVDINSLYRT
jgi:glutamate N-acetyltransferase/amino-acid N-acetyltransferase